MIILKAAASYSNLYWTDKIAVTANIVTIVGLFLAVVGYMYTIGHDIWVYQNANKIRSIKLVQDFNLSTKPKINQFNHDYQLNFESDWQAQLKNIQITYPNLNLDDDHVIDSLRQSFFDTVKVHTYHIGLIVNDLEIIALYVIYHSCYEKLVKMDLQQEIVQFYHDNQSAIKQFQLDNTSYQTINQLIDKWEGDVND